MNVPADHINLNYVAQQLNCYNNRPLDDFLYRIGTHTDVLTPEDTRRIDDEQNGGLTAEQRYRVLDWIVCAGFEIKSDLALLIFGRNQLQYWLDRSRQAYPDFEFYLVFEYQESKGWESGINFTMHWTPRPGAPEPDVELDFPWKSYWERGEMFWGEYPGGFTNQFDFNLDCYPNQKSFTKPGWICEEGDRYTTPSDEEADLMSVAQVLEHFSAVPA